MIQCLQTTLHSIDQREQLLFPHFLVSEAHLLPPLTQGARHVLVVEPHVEVVLRLTQLEVAQSHYLFQNVPTCLLVMAVR